MISKSLTLLLIELKYFFRFSRIKQSLTIV